MAAQLRYRTLVHNIGRVYASPAEGRTDLLQAGLDEIVTTQQPATATDWNVVGTDSERLLKVWVAKEGGAAANEAAAQIVDLLYELAALEKTPAPVPTPSLVVTDSAADRIAHVLPFFSTLLPAAAGDISSISGPAASVHIAESDEESSEGEVEESSEEEVEVEVEVDEAEEEAAEEEETEEAEAEESSEAEEEIEEAAEEKDTEEVIEPAEEEEEEGMEVEQIFIRGRAYWHETNTNKLYELVGEDDVGDEVGELVGGKPRFYAK